MAVSSITSKGQVTIPKAIRDKFGLAPGTQVAFEERDGEVILHAQRLIDADQAWFWTPEWQQAEREADDDIAQGRVSGPYKDARRLTAALRDDAADD